MKKIFKVINKMNEKKFFSRQFFTRFQCHQDFLNRLSFAYYNFINENLMLHIRKKTQEKKGII